MFRRLLLTGLLLAIPAGEAWAWVAKPSLSTEFRFEKNSGVAADGSGSGDDSILRASPRLEMESSSMNVGFNAGYGFTGNYYLDDHDRDWVAHNAVAGLEMRISPLSQLQAGYDFTYTREPREATATGIEAFRTEGIRSHNASVNGSRTISPRLTGSLSLSGNVLEFEDPSAVDSRTYSAGAAGEFRWTERTSLTQSYEYTNLTYDNGPSTEIQSHSLSAGFSTRHSESLTYNLSAGLIYSTGISEHSDWRASAGLSKSFQRGSVSASYSRGVSDSSGLTDELNISETVSAGFSRNLSDAASLTLTTGYARNRTKPAGTVDLKSYSADAGVRWQVKRWAIIGAGISHFNQLSEGITGSDAERNAFYLNLTVHSEYRP
ncbi:MAG: hypothetical protein K8I01_08400 [Candidatus Methylomirabilis sp.]|nr:hypothetical protein [Deltaproteobacteria bacterium]